MIGKSRKKSTKKDNQAVTLDDSLIIVNKDEKKTKSKFNIRLFAIVIFICLLIFTLIFGLKYVSFGITEMLWKTSLTRGSSDVNNKSIRYESFKNGLFRISNDGITYIDKNGKVRFAVSYNMSDPIYDTTKNYFAIADKNSFEFYIFDDTGVVGKNTATYPIQDISLSSAGILYILQSDENSSYINLYRQNGNAVDISIKNNFTGDGMPVDISVSPDGTELLVDYTCLSDDSIFSKATYYNFDEVGKSVSPKRIVGEIVDALDGKFLARVHFFTDDRSCLVYDGGIIFVSTSMLTNPSIIRDITFENKIKSISYNDKYFITVFDDNTMQIFDKNGDNIATKSLDFEYDNFYISDDYIIFLYGNRVMIYDCKARLIFDKELTQNVQYIAKKKSFVFTELLLGLIDGVECIRFY